MCQAIFSHQTISFEIRLNDCQTRIRHNTSSLPLQPNAAKLAAVRRIPPSRLKACLHHRFPELGGVINEFSQQSSKVAFSFRLYFGNPVVP